MADKQTTNNLFVKPYWFDEIQKKIKKRKRNLENKDQSLYLN